MSRWHWDHAAYPLPLPASTPPPPTPTHTHRENKAGIAGRAAFPGSILVVSTKEFQFNVQLDCHPWETLQVSWRVVDLRCMALNAPSCCPGAPSTRSHLPRHIVFVLLAKSQGAQRLHQFGQWHLIGLGELMLSTLPSSGNSQARLLLPLASAIDVGLKTRVEIVMQG